jgi:hypothetical protein
MDIKFVADYELTINVNDQDSLTDEEFAELAEDIGVVFKQALMMLQPPPEGASVDVRLLSATVNGNPLNGVSNAQ